EDRELERRLLRLAAGRLLDPLDHLLEDPARAADVEDPPLEVEPLLVAQREREELAVAVEGLVELAGHERALRLGDALREGDALALRVVGWAVARAGLERRLDGALERAQLGLGLLREERNPAQRERLRCEEVVRVERLPVLGEDPRVVARLG